MFFYPKLNREVENRLKCAHIYFSLEDWSSQPLKRSYFKKPRFILLDCETLRTYPELSDMHWTTRKKARVDTILNKLIAESLFWHFLGSFSFFS